MHRIRTPTYCRYFGCNSTITLKLLKGYCHESENRYNGFQVIDLKNVGLPDHIFSHFDAIFMF
jgi:hypothetical protein